nr:type II toxin-antitoxin system VapC family toxin [uncultured Dyadobacter sp.]
MRYLLDTHTLIWTFFETSRLSPTVTDIISNKRNAIYVSSIVFWEICIKVGCGKLKLGDKDPEMLPGICIEYGFELMALTASDTGSLHQLSGSHHKDPFDRMLIWQAICNDMTLVTDDRYILKYASAGLKTIW